MERKQAAASLALLFCCFAGLSILPCCTDGGEQATVEDVKVTDTRGSFHLPLGDTGTLFGPESLAFDGNGGGPYTGVSDGRVLKWGGMVAGWTTFAYNSNHRKLPECWSPKNPVRTESTCGRPLGLRFHRKSGDLYMADAYLGLMRVGPAGGEAEVLATEADGVPFRFVNGVDVDQATGEVYFTDSSTTYPRREHELIKREGDATGRLMRFDPRTRRVAVLRSGLPYSNGVAMSRDRTHLVVVHTSPCQVFRHWLRGPRAGAHELFADVPGYPDNVRPDGRGGYWVGLYCEKANATAPPPAAGRLVGARLGGGGGEALEVLTAADGVTLSEVVERGRVLWLGSVELAYVGVLDYETQRNSDFTL